MMVSPFYQGGDAMKEPISIYSPAAARISGVTSSLPMAII